MKSFPVIGFWLVAVYIAAYLFFNSHSVSLLNRGLTGQ